MRIIAIIPARMSSSRFPGKPLKLINKVPMIKHVYDNVKESNKIKTVYVATCDKEIYEFIKSIGGNAIYTSKKHRRASDRTAEAMLKIEKKLKKKFDIIVMVQGDEPMVKSNMIDKSLKPFEEDNNVNIVNLMVKIKDHEEFNDLNEPKVVIDKFNNALYFSRCPIPSSWLFYQKNIFKQVCVIPFKRNYLLRFNKMKPTLLEKAESIDMNRVIENGEKVKMVKIMDYVKSVDTKADLYAVEKLLKNK